MDHPIDIPGLIRKAGGGVCLMLFLATSLGAQTERVEVTLSGEVRVHTELDS